MNKLWWTAFIFYLAIAALFVWTGKKFTESFSRREGEGPTAIYWRTEFISPKASALLPAYKYEAGQYESFYRNYPDSDHDGLNDDIDHEPYNAKVY